MQKKLEEKEMKEYYEASGEKAIVNDIPNPFYDFSKPYYIHRAKRTVNFVLSQIKGERVLDAGCGPGLYLKILGDKGFCVYGVDFSSSFIKMAKRRMGGGKISLIEASIESLPLRNDSFDSIICLGVLEHLKSPGRGLTELSRVLERGGTLILLLPNHSSLKEKIGDLCGLMWPAQPEHHITYKDAESLLLKEQNLSDIQIIGFHYFLILNAINKMVSAIAVRLIPFFEWLESHQFLPEILAPHLIITAKKKLCARNRGVAENR